MLDQLNVSPSLTNPCSLLSLLFRCYCTDQTYGPDYHVFTLS